MEYNYKPKFLRAKELAKYLCIGQSTVWYYLKKGKIQSNKISEKVTLFDVEAVKSTFKKNMII